MVIKNQNKKQRYENSVAIASLGILVLVFVIRFGILIQKSESDLLSISNQIKYYNTNIGIQKRQVKVLHRKGTLTGQVLTGAQISTGIQNNSGSKDSIIK